MYQASSSVKKGPKIAIHVQDVELPRDADVAHELGGVDTSILHHAFISIFIALWAVITHYISILMAILSYFTRFSMKRGNAGSWNSGWKTSKHWKPILHCSKNPETPRNMFLELKRIIEWKKYIRGPTPWPGECPPTGRAPVSWTGCGPPGLFLSLINSY